MDTRTLRNTALSFQQKVIIYTNIKENSFTHSHYRHSLIKNDDGK